MGGKCLGTERAPSGVGLLPNKDPGGNRVLLGEKQLQLLSKGKGEGGMSLLWTVGQWTPGQTFKAWATPLESGIGVLGEDRTAQ